MFKQLLTLAAAACISMSASAAILWESEDAKGFQVDWGQPCVALTPAEVAEAIAPGDYINVTTVGVDPENGWPQVALFGQYGGWPPLANEGVGGKESYPVVSTFPVTSDLYESIAADGLSVSGNGAYVGKVEVVPSGIEVGPNTVWFGNKACGWGNGVSLPASLFQDVRVGDKLAFYVDGVGFQVLFGGWSGLNVPCYEFPANVTYIDGVATYTLTKAYEEEGVLDLIKANGIIMHGTVTITRIDYIPTDVLADAVGHATTIEGWEDEVNIAPAADLNIQYLKGDKVRVNAWAGVEGYDIIFGFDADWNITSLTPVYNGVEDNTYTNGWAYIKTGNGEEFFTAYLSEGYDGAGWEEGEGFVWLQGYMNNTDFQYYYVEWPLTAEELIEAITAAYDEDIAQIQEWSEAYAQLQEEYGGFGATEAGAESFSAIAQAIQANNEAVVAALEAAEKSWGYTSPLSGGIITEVNEMIIGTVADCTEFMLAIYDEAEADVDIIDSYACEVTVLVDSEELSEEGLALADNIKMELAKLLAEIDAAADKAITETGVYESPLTDYDINKLNKLMADLKTSGINSINADAANATYYDINGMLVKNPVAGQVVIKVKNGTVSKVLVK